MEDLWMRYSFVSNDYLTVEEAREWVFCIAYFLVAPPPTKIRPLTPDEVDGMEHMVTEETIEVKEVTEEITEVKEEISEMREEMNETREEISEMREVIEEEAGIHGELSQFFSGRPIPVRGPFCPWICQFQSVQP